MYQQTQHISTTHRDTHRLEEWQHDPYHAKAKWHEPAFCPECGAVYQQGRWQWLAVQESSEAIPCPACQRMRDDCPAAFLTIRGDFFSTHREEILQRVHHIAEDERRLHPLKRIMSEEQTADGKYSIRYTDPHLARSTGQALHAAYHGQLHIDDQKDEYLLRVAWER